MEIPYGAELPAILWKFHRVCGEGAPKNPHFYPSTPFDEEIINRILPLRDRNANKHDGKWTERIFVYGDNRDGRIKLTSEDERITRLFGAVTQCLVQPLTLFKGQVRFLGQLLNANMVLIDIEGHILTEKGVNHVFSGAGNIKCFRWRNSSFEIDPDVMTLQDIINPPKVRLVCIALDKTDTNVCRDKRQA